MSGFSAFGPSCQDGQGHGTHVAGTVAARDNGTDVLGVAPAAQLYCVKVLDNSGSGSDATLMAGLDWVLSNHNSVVPAIKVINMSLGRPGTVNDNTLMRELILRLDGVGISVVAAAGNDPLADVSEQIPAAYPEVIAVASTTARIGSNQCRFLGSAIAADTASYFTTDGIGVTVSAPGEEQEDVNRSCFIQSIGILSTRLGGGTTRMSGTSMASPHVAGVAARYYQQDPALAPSEVKFWIAQNASRPDVAPLDSPTSSYTFDGVKEGIAQGPLATIDPRTCTFGGVTRNLAEIGGLGVASSYAEDTGCRPDDGRCVCPHGDQGLPRTVPRIICHQRAPRRCVVTTRLCCSERRICHVAESAGRDMRRTAHLAGLVQRSGCHKGL